MIGQKIINSVGHRILLKELVSITWLKQEKRKRRRCSDSIYVGATILVSAQIGRKYGEDKIYLIFIL